MNIENISSAEKLKEKTFELYRVGAGKRTPFAVQEFEAYKAATRKELINLIFAPSTVLYSSGSGWAISSVMSLQERLTSIPIAVFLRSFSK